MNWDAVTAIAELVGLVAVVISLLYVGFQVRQNTNQLQHDNLRQSIRDVLDINWHFHRDPAAFAIFSTGIKGFGRLDPQEQAYFHSLLVDLAFYFEMIRNMHRAGLIDRAAVETNQRFLLAVLVTPGGREWWDFARRTRPMPSSAMDYLQAAMDAEGETVRPITELQPWFAGKSESLSS